MAKGQQGAPLSPDARMSAGAGIGSTENQERGRLGEEHVRRLLREHLPEHWLVLHGRRVPHSRCDLDHIVIGPPGVFVIDTKNIRSVLRVHGDAVWDTQRRRIDLEPLRFATNRVRKRLGVPPTAVACFVGQRLTGEARDVELTGAEDLVALLKHHSPQFEPELVQAFHDVLRRTFPPVGWRLLKRQRRHGGQAIVDEQGRQVAVWSEHEGLSKFWIEHEADAMAVVREGGEQQRLQI